MVVYYCLQKDRTVTRCPKNVTGYSEQ